MKNTVMPDRIDLGRVFQSTMGHPINNRKNADFDIAGRRSVMGFPLPDWQRPFVWTDDQCVRFLESAWLGLSLGTFSYNEAEIASPLDGLLIDGQQRLRAVERYLDDEFPVFGYRWGEVTIVDRRRFDMSTSFPCYVTRSNDEDWLRSYYGRMNFGGTAHTQDQRAALARSLSEEKADG